MLDTKGKAPVAIHAKTGTDSSEVASESSSAAMAPTTPPAGDEPALATSASDSKLPEARSSSLLVTGSLRTLLTLCC